MLYSSSGYANCNWDGREYKTGTRIFDSTCQSDGSWLNYPDWLEEQEVRAADRWCQQNRGRCRELSWWEKIPEWGIPIIEDRDENNMPNVLF